EAVEGAGTVAGRGHKGDLPGTLIYLQLLGDTDEAGIVVVAVGHVVAEDTQAIEPGAVHRGNGSDVRTIRLGYILGSGGVVAEHGDFGAAALEKLAALVEGLLV